MAKAPVKKKVGNWKGYGAWSSKSKANNKKCPQTSLRVKVGGGQVRCGYLVINMEGDENLRKGDIQLDTLVLQSCANVGEFPFRRCGGPSDCRQLQAARK